MVAAEDELVAVNLMEQVKQVLNEYNKRKRVITRSEGFAVAKTSNAWLYEARNHSPPRICHM
jgi:hypothetical protein